ncbi:unnamed protein product, partial [Strongylus vulgaris]
MVRRSPGTIRGTPLVRYKYAAHPARSLRAARPLL